MFKMKSPLFGRYPSFLVAIPSFMALMFGISSSLLVSEKTQTPAPETKQLVLDDPLCMYTLNTYSGDTGAFTTADLHDVDGASGAVTGPVATSLESTIGLEMDAAGDLYTVELKNVLFTGLVAKLHRINPTTGASTFIGDLGILPFEGDLAFHPISEVLYGVGKDGTLFTIDTGTGAATIIGVIPSPNGPSIEISYLTFDLSGNLYALDNGTNWAINSYWLQVDPGTAALMSSNLMTPKVEDPGGMDVHPVTGEIYMLESDGSPSGPGPFQLHTVNSATGARTLVGPLVNNTGYSGLAICGPPPPCTTPPTGMVGWWSFDEPNTIGGGTLYATLDISGSAPNTGIRSGAALYGGDLNLNGGHVDVQDHPELNFGQLQDFSIDAWINTSSNAFNQTIVDKRLTSGTPGYLLTLYQGRILLQMADGGGYSNFWSNATPQWNDGFWHFVAVSVDRDQPDGIKMYVDGNLIATFNPMGRSGSLANTSHLRIGKHSFSNSNFFRGRIDEVEIFNRVVPEAEFDLIYEAAESGKCKPCMVDTAFILEPSSAKEPVSSMAILANMRQFRDQVMGTTQTGQYFADVYKAYNMRAAWLLFRDQALLRKTVDLLKKYHPTFVDLVKGQATETVSEEMIVDGQEWLNLLIDSDLNHAGGGDLAEAIQREMGAIDWETINHWRVQDLLRYHDR